MVIHMKQLLVELDDATARELERVAPAKERQRSAFVRQAIRRALDAEIERRTEAAYRATPQTERPVDPLEWDAAGWPSPAGRRKSKRK